MPRKVSELTGQRFGKLEVISRAPNNKQHRTMWNCKCDCGNVKTISSQSLKRGATTSCGCVGKTSNLSHGMTGSKEHYAWLSMKRRCNDKTNPYYGAKGIKVCEEWLNSFEAFYDHIGPAPSKEHSVDRIDPKKNYEPGNVRWATGKIQRANQNRTGIRKPKNDLTGKTFGWLTVKERDMSKTGSKTYWICECQCGNIISRRASTLNDKVFRSCGCYKSNQHTV